MYDVYIVTPVRNCTQYIDDAIWSIVSQSGDISVRYHIQDGNSTDGTQQKIAAWEEKLLKFSAILPAKIHFSWESSADSGMYDGICKGFKHMDIPPNAFMTWLNADDMLFQGVLDAIARLGRTLPYVRWITGYHMYLMPHGATTAGKDQLFPREVIAAGLAEGAHWRFIQQEGTFWRKNLWDKVGGLNTSFRLAGDWDLWRRFAQQVPLVYTPRQFGAFRKRPGQQTVVLSAYYDEMEKKLSWRQRNLRCRGILQNTKNFEILVAQQTVHSGEWELFALCLDPAETSITLKEDDRWRHTVKHTPDSKKQAPLFISDLTFDEFTYARESHMHMLNGSYIMGKFGQPLDIHFCDLKAYQDGLCNAFIDQMLSTQSKILEIGGGESRVLPLYGNVHECWNLDKFEGVGNGPRTVPIADYRTVFDYIGAFNRDLPDNYFDFVFSISALEHVEEDIDNFRNIVEDINRILKPGGHSLHLFDIISRHGGTLWQNGLVDYMFSNLPTLNKYCDPAQFHASGDIYYMKQQAYDVVWKNTTKTDYEKFGKPGNITVFWKKV